jgi:hypothetical protein
MVISVMSKRNAAAAPPSVAPLTCLPGWVGLRKSLRRQTPATRGSSVRPPYAKLP